MAEGMDFENHWLARAIRAWVATHKDANGLNGYARLAEATGVNRNTLERYGDGKNPPDLIRAEHILKIMGWDISRADPNWRPPAVSILREELELEYKNPILTGPEVAGGTLSGIDGRGLVEDFERASFNDLWRDSPMWPYADHQKESIVARVRGNSMAPIYPDGSRIVLGAYNYTKLPEMAPCVFCSGAVDSEERTFKLHRTATDGKVIGWPLNPEHPPVIFNSRPKIEFVVLGICNSRPHDATNSVDLFIKPKRRG